MEFLFLMSVALPQVGTGLLIEPPRSHSPVISAGRQCKEGGPRRVQAWDQPGKARRLGELPPGRLELAVLRKVDGCFIPAVVREGLGEVPNAGEGRR